MMKFERATFFGSIILKTMLFSNFLWKYAFSARSVSINCIFPFPVAMGDEVNLFLSKLLLHGESILAEIFRLSGFVPKEFRDPAKSPKFRNIVQLDFKYLSKAEQVEKELEKDLVSWLLHRSFKNESFSCSDSKRTSTRRSIQCWSPSNSYSLRFRNSCTLSPATFRKWLKWMKEGERMGIGLQSWRLFDFYSINFTKKEVPSIFLHLPGLLPLHLGSSAHLPRHLPARRHPRTNLHCHLPEKWCAGERRVPCGFLADNHWSQWLYDEVSNHFGLFQSVTFRRLLLPEAFVRSCLYTVEISEDSHLKVPKTQLMYVILQFDRHTLTSDVARMTRISNSIYRETWAINLGFGVIANIFDAWFPYKAAWNALNATITQQEANGILEKHLKVVKGTHFPQVCIYTTTFIEKTNKKHSNKCFTVLFRCRQSSLG